MMAKIRFLLLLLLFAGCAATQGGLPERPDRLGDEHVTFALPTVTRWEMPNGLVVYYRYNDELPRMSGTFYFPGGSLYEPLELAGLASGVGSQLREGSIPGMSPEAFDRKLDSLAAVIETSFGAENGSLSFSSLSEDFATIFSYSAQIILNPQFDRSRFELWRKLASDAIRRRKDNPDTMLGIAFAEIVFGKNTAFAHYASTETLARITPASMRAFANEFVRPNGSILAVSGSIPEAEFRLILERELASWAKRPNPVPPLPEITQEPQGGIYVLQRDFQQASIFIGHLGPPRLTPDIYEMSIYNRIFGSSGFGSRLFDEIRTKLGLAYDVSGGMAPGAVKGTVGISLGSRNDGAMEAIKRAIEITRDTLETLPSAEAFHDAKSAVEQSFAFKFDSAGGIVSRAAQQEFFHFEKDFDATYLERMKAVSPEMVREVGRRWVKPNDFSVVIVGNITPKQAADFFRPLGWSVYRLDFDTTSHVREKVE